MADDQTQIDIKIQATIDASEAAKTLGDLKKSSKELMDLYDNSDIGSAQFEKLGKALEDTDKQITKNAKGINSLGQAMEGLGSTIPGVEGAMAALNIVLDANPIGLLVIAIGLLVAGFMASEPVMHKIEQIMGAINGVIGVLVDRLGMIATGLAEIFSGNVKKGFADINDAITGVGEAAKNAAKAGFDAAKDQQDLDREKSKNLTVIATKEKELAELRDKARVKDKDQAKNQQAVIDKEKEITDIKKEEASGEVAILQKKYAQELKDQGHYTDAHLKEIQEAKASEINIETEGDTKTRRERSQLANEQIAAQKKAQAEIEKHLKEVDKLNTEFALTEKEKIDKKYDDDLKLLKKSDKNYDKIVAGINAKRKKDKEKIDAELLKKTKEQLDKVNKLTLEASLDTDQIELGKSKAVEQSQKEQIKIVQDKYDEEIKAAKGNKQKIAEIEANKSADLKVLRDQDIKDIQDVNQKEIDAAQGAAAVKQETIDDTADKEIESAKGNADLIKAINDKRDADKLKAEQDLQDNIVKINQNSTKQIEDLKKQEVDDAIEASQKKKEAIQADAKEAYTVASGLMSALNDLSNLFTELESQKRNQSAAQKLKAAKKEFEINKALGLVNAGIHTAEAITTAAIGPPGLPSPTAIAGIVMASVTGAAQIAAIAAKKFTPGSTSTSSPTPSLPSASSGGSSQFQPSSFQSLGSINPQQIQNQSSQQVYVTTTDLNSALDKVNVSKSRSTIG